MATLFQSEEMTLCQIFIQFSSTYACVSELGELGLIDVRDLNPDVNIFNRKFVHYVRRCIEMERRLRYIEKELKKEEIPILEIEESPEAPQPQEMNDLEATLEKLESEVLETNKNYGTLKRNFCELTEFRHLLRKTPIFFEEAERGIKTTDSIMKALISDQSRSVSAFGTEQLGLVAGVIRRERFAAFELMLWRISRGLVFMRHSLIDPPVEECATGEKEVHKNVFLIFFQGQQLKSIVKKVCQGFRATLYPCPEAPSERQTLTLDVMTKIEDLNLVLRRTEDHRRRLLLAAAKNLRSWTIKVIKMKAIYHTLNHFNVDVTEKLLIAEGWAPNADLEQIQKALNRGMETSRSTVRPILNRLDTNEIPPTYNRTNRFTEAFQALIDAYGVPNYREMNPMPYTIITFPFLFAIMFGDLGHGLIMMLFGLWMVLKEKPLQIRKSTNEIWNIFFGGRYIILLMGCFSMYIGIIYNDVFAKSINIFGSNWMVPVNTSTILAESTLQLDPRDSYAGDPYPFGLDPIWQVAPMNKIIFHNAYKMKISIIFGVIHMIFGILVGFFNYRYFNNRLSIFCEFIPQIIFLCSLFFYLVFLMFVKWSKFSVDQAPPFSSHCAPSILITFINMVMMKTDNRAENDPCSPWMFVGQSTLQTVLLVLALVCVPWMLLSKPLILYWRHKRDLGVSSTSIAETSTPQTSNVSVSHEDEDPSEIFIHQAIHTIEYVLGSVSHTASYLRLWALSLAHAQLAEVLWNMVLKIGLQADGWSGGLTLFGTFGFWAVFSVAILVLMEGLSAFLHTLRLHWVEFQSKFYMGQGYPFTPFSFKTILDSYETSKGDD